MSGHTPHKATVTAPPAGPNQWPGSASSWCPLLSHTSSTLTMSVCRLELVVHSEPHVFPIYTDSCTASKKCAFDLCKVRVRFSAFRSLSVFGCAICKLLCLVFVASITSANSVVSYKRRAAVCTVASCLQTFHDCSHLLPHRTCFMHRINQLCCHPVSC